MMNSTDYFYVYCDETGKNESDNDTETSEEKLNRTAITTFLVSSYTIICIAGLIGNALVIYVVLRFAKMKTVTNLYILNLAVSDAMFLISLPFLITTTVLEHWIFDTAMCKIYFVLYSINFITSVLTLTALSGDRYLAVCHPVSSGRYRTTKIAFFVCLLIWSLSFFVMLPIILYSTTIPNSKDNSHDTCTVKWPEDQLIPPEKAFTWYTFLLGFAIPVSLIFVFYLSVVLNLSCVGPGMRTANKKRSRRKVTRLVFAVIGVYILCWLPHWVFQVNLTFQPQDYRLKDWEIYLFNGLTVLTYANSMLNPLLYAFLSDNFRRCFRKAFKCAENPDAERRLTIENSVLPKSCKKKKIKKAVPSVKTKGKYELATLTTAIGSALILPNDGLLHPSHQETTSLYVDKEIQTS